MRRSRHLFLTFIVLLGIATLSFPKNAWAQRGFNSSRDKAVPVCVGVYTGPKLVLEYQTIERASKEPGRIAGSDYNQIVPRVTEDSKMFCQPWGPFQIDPKEFGTASIVSPLYYKDQNKYTTWKIHQIGREKINIPDTDDGLRVLQVLKELEEEYAKDRSRRRRYKLDALIRDHSTGKKLLFLMSKAEIVGLLEDFSAEVKKKYPTGKTYRFDLKIKKFKRRGQEKAEPYPSVSIRIPSGNEGQLLIWVISQLVEKYRGDEKVKEAKDPVNAKALFLKIWSHSKGETGSNLFGMGLREIAQKVEAQIPIEQHIERGIRAAAASRDENPTFLYKVANISGIEDSSPEFKKKWGEYKKKWPKDSYQKAMSELVFEWLERVQIETGREIILILMYEGEDPYSFGYHLKRLDKNSEKPKRYWKLGSLERASNRIITITSDEIGSIAATLSVMSGSRFTLERTDSKNERNYGSEHDYDKRRDDWGLAYDLSGYKVRTDANFGINHYGVLPVSSALLTEISNIHNNLTRNGRTMVSLRVPGIFNTQFGLRAHDIQGRLPKSDANDVARVIKRLRDRSTSSMEATRLVKEMGKGGYPFIPILIEVLREEGAGKEFSPLVPRAIEAIRAMGTSGQDSAPMLVEILKNLEAKRGESLEAFEGRNNRRDNFALYLKSLDALLSVLEKGGGGDPNAIPDFAPVEILLSHVETQMRDQLGVFTPKKGGGFRNRIFKKDEELKAKALQAENAAVEIASAVFIYGQGELDRKRLALADRVKDLRKKVAEHHRDFSRHHFDKNDLDPFYERLRKSVTDTLVGIGPAVVLVLLKAQAELSEEERKDYLYRDILIRVLRKMADAYLKDETRWKTAEMIESFKRGYLTYQRRGRPLPQVKNAVQSAKKDHARDGKNFVLGSPYIQTLQELEFRLGDSSAPDIQKHAAYVVKAVMDQQTTSGMQLRWEMGFFGIALGDVINNSKEQETRLQCVKALGQLATLRDDPLRQYEIRRIKTRGKITGQPIRYKGEESLARIILNDNESKKLRNVAIDALWYTGFFRASWPNGKPRWGHMITHDDMNAHALELIDRNDPEKQIMGYKILGATTKFTQEVAQAFREAFGRDDRKSRDAFVELVRWFSPRASEKLKMDLYNRSHRVRAVAIQALGRFRPGDVYAQLGPVEYPKFLKSLIKLVQDDNTSVANYATLVAWKHVNPNRQNLGHITAGNAEAEIYVKRVLDGIKEIRARSGMVIPVRNMNNSIVVQYALEKLASDFPRTGHVNVQTNEIRDLVATIRADRDDESVIDAFKKLGRLRVANYEILMNVQRRLSNYRDLKGTRLTAGIEMMGNFPIRDIYSTLGYDRYKKFRTKLRVRQNFNAAAKRALSWLPPSHRLFNTYYGRDVVTVNLYGVTTTEVLKSIWEKECDVEDDRIYWEQFAWFDPSTW